ncbi:type IA DNA topoisomerase, partial [Bacillus pseudomycoides]|uniref:DNA topoisomerase n=1 Tax=Bacillus pseudomycoides TaxID=64104 RepID=UPI00283B935E
THIPVAEAEQLPNILERLSSIKEYQSLIENKERHTIVDQKAYVDNAKCGDHYAIITTNQVPKVESLSQDEKWLYDEVVRSVIATFYNPMTYNLFTKVNEGIFKSTARQIIYVGWQVVCGKEEKEEAPDEMEQSLQFVGQGQQIDTKEINKYEGKTQPPKLYTEGQLI